MNRSNWTPFRNSIAGITCNLFLICLNKKKNSLSVGYIPLINNNKSLQQLSQGRPPLDACDFHESFSMSLMHQFLRMFTCDTWSKLLRDSMLWCWSKCQHWVSGGDHAPEHEWWPQCSGAGQDRSTIICHPSLPTYPESEIPAQFRSDCSIISRLQF